MPQGPPNPGFMQEKIQKGDFLKKDSQDFKILFNLGSCEFLARLESQIRKYLFFGGAVMGLPERRS